MSHILYSIHLMPHKKANRVITTLTASHWSPTAASLTCVRFLQNQTILHKLAQRGHAEYLRLYASKYAKDWGVDVNARDAMGRSALDYAILEVPEEAQALGGAKRMEAQIASLAVLVESLGARVELDEEERRLFRSPLLLAVNLGSIQVAQWLMEKGAGAFSPCWRGPVVAEGLEGELDHPRGDLKRLHELWPGLTTPFGLMVSKTKVPHASLSHGIM